MFGALKRLFPIKPRSLSDFIDTVKKECCSTVQILPIERSIGLPGPAGASLFVFTPAGSEWIGTEWHLKYFARTPHGRKIIFSSARIVRYARAGIFGREAREAEVVQLFLMQEQRARFLRGELPGVTVEELDWLGIPMTEAMRRDICSYAAERGTISPREHL